MRPCHPCVGHDCAKCGGFGFVPNVPEPVETTDVRVALEQLYLDYAEQAFHRGNWIESETWRKAADMARGFVTRRVVKL
jgi:hypothetical protein